MIEKPELERKRIKPRAMKEYAIPEGRLQSAMTPGYDIKNHRKLTAKMFAEPLFFLQWQRWYHQELANSFDHEVELMLEAAKTNAEKQIEGLIELLDSLDRDMLLKLKEEIDRRL